MKPKTEIAHITTPVAKYTLDFKTGIIKAKPIITNGDSVRSMSDDELASFITDDLCELLCGAPSVCEWHCKQKMLDWLKEECE